MNLRQRPQALRRPEPVYPPPPPRPPEVYNIIPIHNLLLTDHPSLRFPEVRAAVAALRLVDDLRKPQFVLWTPDMDLMDWVGYFFGFQEDNVRNQREHLVLHLANTQMRMTPPPPTPDALYHGVVHDFRKKLLKNYTSWCSYLGQPKIKIKIDSLTGKVAPEVIGKNVNEMK